MTKRSKPDELNQAQRLAIAAISSGASFPEAARVAGVCEKTIYNWHKNPLFSETLARENLSKLRDVSTMVVDEAEDAMRSIVNLYKDDHVGPTVRFSAAKYVVDLAYQIQEQEILLRRIAALEQAQAEQSGA